MYCMSDQCFYLLITLLNQTGCEKKGSYQHVTKALIVQQILIITIRRFMKNSVKNTWLHALGLKGLTPLLLLWLKPCQWELISSSFIHVLLLLALSSFGHPCLLMKFHYRSMFFSTSDIKIYLGWISLHPWTSRVNGLKSSCLFCQIPAGKDKKYSTQEEESEKNPKPAVLEAPFVPPCQVKHKDANSALRRVKSESCKRLIYKTACLSEAKKLYNFDIKRTCPVPREKGSPAKWIDVANTPYGNPIRIAFVVTLHGRAFRQVRRLFKALYHSNHYFFFHIDSVSFSAILWFKKIHVQWVYASCQIFSVVPIKRAQDWGRGNIVKVCKWKCNTKSESQEGGEIKSKKLSIGGVIITSFLKKHISVEEIQIVIIITRCWFRDPGPMIRQVVSTTPISV